MAIGGVIACQGSSMISPTGPSGRNVASGGSFHDGDFVYREVRRVYKSTGSPQESRAVDASAVRDAASGPMPSADAGAAGPADAGPPPAPGAPSGRTDQVEEADLYRLDGNTLFYLSTYKGLSIFSLNDPKKPKKLASLPVFGVPLEMFFDKNRAYVLIKDALYLHKDKGTFQFKSRRVSQLVIVDLADRSAPKVIQRFDIQGRLREGLSRKIGDIIYVVTYTPRYYYRTQTQESAMVISFDIANPQSVKQIQSIELIDPSRKPDGAQTNSSLRFRGLTISATSNTLLVSEQWSHYSRECYGSRWIQQTVLNLIDISDPKGAIRVHTRLTARGWVTDQFKQTYAFDPKTQKGIYYGIFQQNEWESTGCRTSGRLIRNRLVSIDISDGQNPKILDSLIFGKPNETVRGSLFDLKRKVAYAITAVQTDPLYAISFADPKDLKILSAIDGLSGDINVFRLIEGGQFLMGIGRDNSDHCSGFQGQNDWASTKVSVSIFDVRDLNKVKLVQRKCVAVQNPWSFSQVSNNRDQAHKMIGMISDATLNAVSVPVSYYRVHRDRYWWYGYETAIGLMSWDVKRYDPTKDETQQQVLQQLGTVIHSHGQVKRTILLHLTHNQQKRRYALNLSETHMSLVDLQDPQKPALLSSLAMNPYIHDVYRFGDHIAIHSGSRDSRGYNQFEVKKLGAGPIDQLPTLSTVTVGAVDGVAQWKHYLLLFHRKLDQSTSEKRGYPVYATGRELIVYDYTDPANPQLHGTQQIDQQIATSLLQWLRKDSPYTARSTTELGRGYILQGRMFAMTDRGLVALQNRYNGNGMQWELQSFDLQNPAKITMTKTLLPADPAGSPSARRTGYYGLIKSNDGTTFVLTRRFVSSHEADGWEHTHYRFYAQALAWRDGSWSLGARINVPGRVLKAYHEDGATYFVTRDNQLFTQRATTSTQNYTQYPRISWLKVKGDKAHLIATKTFTGMPPETFIFNNKQLYLTTRDPLNKLSTSEQVFWVLTAKDGKFVTAHQQPTGLSSLSLQQAAGNRLLFREGSGPGLLISDVANADKPVGTHYIPLQTWSTNFFFHGQSLITHDGYYGVKHTDLRQHNIR